MGAGHRGHVAQATGQHHRASPPTLSLSFHLPRHCVDLFLDFVDIFRELLMILGMSEVGEGAPERGTGLPSRVGHRAGSDSTTSVLLQKKKKEKK